MELTNHDKRRIRMIASKAKGDHTKDDWKKMYDFFEGRCVRCIEYVAKGKDHIVPVYRGGSNHIRNIQPMCAHCNSSKGPEQVDYRPKLAQFLGKELPNEYKNPF